MIPDELRFGRGRVPRKSSGRGAAEVAGAVAVGVGESRADDGENGDDGQRRRGNLLRRIGDADRVPPRTVRGESRFRPDAVDADVDAPVRQAGTRDASDEAVLSGYFVTVEQLVESGFFRRVGFVEGGGDLDPEA